MKDLARALRRNATHAERRLWRHLRDRRMCGCRFRRQKVIGPYIVDFVCVQARLIIEVDGGQHQFPDRQARDRLRSAYLEARGYTIVRVWNNEVLAETDEVLRRITVALHRRDS